MGHTCMYSIAWLALISFHILNDRPCFLLEKKFKTSDAALFVDALCSSSTCPSCTQHRPTHPRTIATRHLRGFAAALLACSGGRTRALLAIESCGWSSVPVRGPSCRHASRLPYVLMYHSRQAILHKDSAKHILYVQSSRESVAFLNSTCCRSERTSCCRVAYRAHPHAAAALQIVCPSNRWTPLLVSVLVNLSQARHVCRTSFGQLEAASSPD